MGDLKESFWLYGGDGTLYRVHVYQERLDPSSVAGSGSTPGQKTIILENGSPLNYVDENTFKNMATGELLTRSKP